MLSLYLTLIDSEEDKQKFTVLYEEYKRLMFYVAREILDDEHLAEDAVQESFLRIAKNFYKISEVLCPRTKAFVVIITRNVSISIYNKQNRITEMEPFLLEDAAQFTDEVFESISSTVLIDSILQRPGQFRDILYLYHIYGYNFKEISHLLSLTVENAKKRAQRARLMLKQNLEKAGLYNEQ